ncbi:hypothetical protein D3C75_1337290 [compost metagenome]
MVISIGVARDLAFCFTLFRLNFRSSSPASTRSPCFTIQVKYFPFRWEVSMPTCRRTSRPSSVVMPNA